MEDNVMRKYATKSTKARHYLQYDQGETFIYIYINSLSQARIAGMCLRWFMVCPIQKITVWMGLLRRSDENERKDLLRMGG